MVLFVAIFALIPYFLDTIILYVHDIILFLILILIDLFVEINCL